MLDPANAHVSSKLRAFHDVPGLNFDNLNPNIVPGVYVQPSTPIAQRRVTVTIQSQWPSLFGSVYSDQASCWESVSLLFNVDTVPRPKFWKIQQKHKVLGFVEERPRVVEGRLHEDLTFFVAVPLSIHRVPKKEETKKCFLQQDHVRKIELRIFSSKGRSSEEGHSRSSKENFRPVVDSTFYLHSTTTNVVVEEQPRRWDL